MDPDFPHHFPVSNNRSYTGGSDVPFESAPVEYSHAPYAYQPSAYGDAHVGDPLRDVSSLAGAYSSTSTITPSSTVASSSTAHPVNYAYLQSPIDTNVHLTSTSTFQLEAPDLRQLSYRSSFSDPLPSSMVSHPPGLPSPISAISAGQSSSTSRSRREKPRLQLAPDQPLTTQGKPRTRVYVACVQCRTRKIRCDGAKPVCHNCQRRSDANDTCTYDATPKRRGPDRTPGARQRQVSGPGTSEQQPRRRVRTRPIEDAQVPGTDADSTTSTTADNVYQGRDDARSTTSPFSDGHVSSPHAHRSPSVYLEGGPNFPSTSKLDDDDFLPLAPPTSRPLSSQSLTLPEYQEYPQV